ncbi:PDR/VanB family oxidoreductase [Arthrobacter sp. USHLN218]|uniref:PDR/VanB family oxidoreductase n=1 Tax=Arthrobacter sp. USHLN218 TaxID=3081232 RepID=UPI0030183E42
MADVFVAESIREVSPDVKEFTFRPGGPDAVLRPYAPGSHIVVEMSGKANAYSLTGDGTTADGYRISVRRQGDGGGSAWLHDRLRPGGTVRLSPPRSAFAPVATAKHHLYVAAGIGVTPILSHVRAALRWNRSFEVVYGYSASGAPHLEDLRRLAPGRLFEAAGRGQLADILAERLRQQPVGTHAYACGPAGMMAAFQEFGGSLGWPEERLHVEHFAAPGLEPGEPFTVRLASGQAVAVPSGTSALDALAEAGVAVPALCRQGVCGQCRVDVSAGIPEHRDLILTSREREANDCFYPCVSRAQTDELELEL